MLRKKLIQTLKRPMRENLHRFCDYYKICHQFAQILAKVISPRIIYHTLGIWPFSPIPYSKFTVWGRLPPPISAYLKGLPKSVTPDNLPWNSTRRMPLPGKQMGYVVEVEKGIALSNGLMLDQRGNTIIGASHLYDCFIDKRNPAHNHLKKRGLQNKLEKFGPLIKKSWEADFKLKYISGTVLVLSNSHNHFYGHFLFESLGRLALVENKINSYPTIYVANNTPYQKRYLSMLELDKKQIIPADQAMPSGITAERLVMPCYSRMYHHLIDPQITSFLRKKLLPYADRALSQGERIFISRRKARYRRILNEQELLPVLEEYSFSVICLEDYSVDEQISILKFAEIVVSPHGTGLTNLLYCDPGTKILEIFAGLSECHPYMLSASLNLEYFYLSCADSATSYSQRTDITVDLAKFKRAMALLCK